MSYEQNLPKDPYILLSTLNMKLRDQFQDLNNLCNYYNIDASSICDKLKDIGYTYDAGTNQFK